MTDIGFGLLDRRTVITVLFTLVLMQLLFGLQIPVDIKNVVQLFIDLVVLTGYIYLARTIYRLPVAAIVATYTTAGAIESFTKDVFKEIKITWQDTQEQLKTKKGKFSKISKISFLWLLLIFSPVFLVLIWFASIFMFGEATEKRRGESFVMFPVFYRINENFWNVIFGILDRIGIVAVSVIATMPVYANYVKIIGVSGLIVMITLFTLRGDFSALLKDILEKKKEDKKDEEKDPSIELKNSKSSPMYVEIVNSEERPIKIDNSEYKPLYVDFYSKYPKVYGLPVHIMGHSYPIPVQVENAIYVSTSPTSPLHVEVENYSLSVDIENSSPIPVEVTNVVKTESEDDF